MGRLATIAPFGFGDFNPSTLLPVYRHLGCQTAQFYRNPDNPIDLAEARQIAEDAGLPFDSVHGLFGMQYDPSSPDEAIRRASIDVYRAEGEIALLLGGPRVVVHPAPPAIHHGSVTPASRAAREAPLQKSMEELAAIGSELGVVYLIENIPANYEQGADPKKLAQWVRQLDHPNVRMCLDIGHAHMTGGLPNALQHCFDVTTYFHVHDNDSTTDDHRMPGLGSIDWDAAADTFAQLPPGMPLMLELFYPEQEIKQAVQNGFADHLRRWLSLV